MLTNYYGNNPYVNVSILDQQFRETMKEQERLAIKAIITAKKSIIKSKGTELSNQLNNQKNNMQNFAGQTVAANFKEGLTGQAAQAAETHLKSNKFKPNLTSPIK